eukprot:COSAG05_NODE_7867_length_761_cov_0.803625_1_plen_90_part_00
MGCADAAERRASLSARTEPVPFLTTGAETSHSSDNATANSLAPPPDSPAAVRQEEGSRSEQEPSSCSQVTVEQTESASEASAVPQYSGE